MLDKLKNVAKQTFIYGVGGVLNKLLGFVLIPMYMSYIPIAAFGNLVYLEVIIGFLSTFVGFGIGPAHQRFFYKEKEQQTYGTYLFNIFFGSLLISLLTLLPAIVFSDSLSSLLFQNDSSSAIFQIGMWIVLVEVMYAVPLYILQYEQKPVAYLLLNIIKLVLSVAFSVFLVIHMSMGIKGMFLARLIGGGTILIISIFIIVMPRCNFKVNFADITKSIKFGLPYVISNLGFTLFSISDRILLSWLSTDEEVGKYGFGFRIANFINLIFVQTIGLGYFPTIMSNEKQADNKRYYRKMLTYYCFLMAILILVFLFTYKDLLKFLGKNMDYWDGLRVVPVLAISFLIGGMNYFVGVGLFLSNKTKFYIIPSLSALLINIGMNYRLIPEYGMMGAAFSVLAAQITYTSMLTFLSGKFMKIGYEWSKIFLIFIISIFIFLATEMIPFSSIFLQITIKVLLLILFPVSLYFAGFFEKIEIQNIMNGIRKMVKRA